MISSKFIKSDRNWKEACELGYLDVLVEKSGKGCRIIKMTWNGITNIHAIKSCL